MTKGELAQKILRLIGVNTRFSEATPEEVSDVVGYIEDWMLSHNAVGRRIGWNQADGEPDPQDETGIPDWSVMGVTNSVAMMIAPYFDKQIHPAIPQSAAIGMQTITNRTVEVQPTQYPNRMPRGKAQYVPNGNQFYHPVNRIRTSNDFLTDEGDDPITTP